MLPPPTAQEELEGGKTCLSPPGINHSSSFSPDVPCFLPILISVFPSSSPSAEELFLSSLLGATSHGDPPPGHPGEPRSQGHSCVAAGETGSTRGRVGHPERGAAAPRPLPLPKPPRRSHFLFLLHPTGFASPWDWGSPWRGRWLRRSPGMVGGSGTPTLSVRALCFLIATGNPFPKPELPYTPRPLPCPEVPYIPRILLINDQPFLAANHSPPLSGGTGTDMPGHVPAALCDLAAWRRWVPHSTLLILPAARQIPRGFRRDRCSEVFRVLGTPGLLSGSAPAGKSPRDMAAPQRASVSPGCWGCHCCQRSPAEARRRDTVLHR